MKKVNKLVPLKLVPLFDLVFTATPSCGAVVTISVNKPFKGFVNGKCVDFVPGDIVKILVLNHENKNL